jgi:hypothetical protein
MAMPRNILAAFALLVVAALVALVLWPANESVQVSEYENLPELDQSGPAVAGQRTPGLEPEETRVAEKALESHPISTRSFPSYEGEDGWSVLVVDGASEVAVPEVSVYMVDLSVVTQLQVNSVYYRSSSGYFALLREFGKRYTTNEAGRVTLPPLVDFHLILAEKGERAAFLDELPSDSKEIKLRLQPNLTFEVRVVQANGEAAANVPVVLQTGSSTRALTRAEETTDQDGVVLFEDLHSLLALLRNNGALRVALGFPMKFENYTEGQRLELTPDILESGLVTLTMPPVGRVRVHLVESTGEVSHADGWVGMQVVENRTTSRMDIRVGLRTSTGVAEFDMAGVGCKLELSFNAYDSNNEDLMVVDGPQQDGELVEVTLHRAARSYLTGTFLDPEGNPLADQRISTRDYYDRGSAGGRLTTDAQGRFRHETRELEEGQKIFEHSIKFTAKTEKFGECKATMELPIPLPPGDFELGEVILAPMPTLLAGLVLDPAGKPVDRAEVEVRWSEEYSPGRRQWRSGDDTGARTKSDGTFQVLGELPPSSDYQVVVKHDGYETLFQSIALGSKAEELHLQKAATMFGSIQLPEGLQRYRPGVFLKDSSGKRLQPEILPVSDPTVMSFVFVGSSETPYSFVVQLSYRQEIFRLENVILKSGEEVRPPELQPLDLRDTLHLIQLQVQNEQGESIKAEARAKIGSMGIDFRGDLKGIGLLAVGTLDEVLVQASGYKPKTLLNVNTSQAVVLESAMAISLQVPAKFIGYRGFRLSFDVNAVAFGDRVFQNSFNESGGATFYATEPGKYSVVLEFHIRLKSGWESVYLPRNTYDIQQTGQVIEVTIDQEELDRKMDELLEP